MLIKTLTLGHTSLCKYVVLCRWNEVMLVPAYPRLFSPNQYLPVTSWGITISLLFRVLEAGRSFFKAFVAILMNILYFGLSLTDTCASLYKKGNKYLTLSTCWKKNNTNWLWNKNHALIKNILHTRARKKTPPLKGKGKEKHESPKSTALWSLSLATSPSSPSRRLLGHGRWGRGGEEGEKAWLGCEVCVMASSSRLGETHCLVAANLVGIFFSFYFFMCVIVYCWIWRFQFLSQCHFYQVYISVAFRYTQLGLNNETTYIL